MKKIFTGRTPFIRHDLVKPGTHWTGTFSHHVFSLTLNGSADYLLNDSLYRIEKGDFLHFTPETWQDWEVNTDSGWDVYYIIIDVPSSLSHIFPKTMLTEGMSRSSLREFDTKRIYNVFEEMNQQELETTPLFKEIIINRLEYILLLIKARQTPSMSIDSRVQKAREFLHRSIETYITLDDLVDEVDISKARISCLFQDAMGSGPITYLEKIRIERAAQLLTLTAERPQDIARRLCYTDPGYFNKRFKKHWGVTPRQYRQRSLNQNENI